MGRKSRAKIEDEFNREQYFRYLKMLRDPEFKDLWEERNKIFEKLKANPNDVHLWPKKESIEKQLRNNFRLEIPDISHSDWMILTEEEKKGLELPIDPGKTLTEDEFKYYIERIYPIFTDMDIITIIRFEEPKLIQTDEPPTIKGEKQESSSEKRIWSKIDYTGSLKDGRYLMIIIDTWNKKERIVTALKKQLEFLEEDGIIQFKSRLRLSTEKERLRTMNLKAQGKTLKEIAYEMWPKQFEKWVEERKTAKKENLEGEERNLYEQFVQRLLEEGKTMGEAYNEADKKFGLREKKIVNPLIIKVHYLLSRKSK